MTFLELKTEVANRLNLSSTDALTRVGSYINQRYRRLTSSIGLVTSRRATTTVATVIGNDTLTVSLEKVNLVYIPGSVKKIIYEIPFEEYRFLSVQTPQSATPTQYAVKMTNPSSTTITLYPKPDAVLTISIDGLSNAATLTDSDTPNIPIDFQDTLILGAMSDELFKMEKYELARDFQKQYEDRLSDLRMFIAKSAFITQTEVANPGGLLTVPRKRWQA